VEVVLDSDWIVSLLLVATRLAGVFLLLPVLGFTVVPARIQLFFVLALSLVFETALGLPKVHVSTTVQLIEFAAVELAYGALLAFSVNTAFAAINLAGQLLDYQIGFNAAALFNFNTQAQDPVLSALLVMTASVMFLVFDVHHELLLIIADTLRHTPPGHVKMELDPHQLALQFGGVFVYGLMVAAPVLLGLFVFDVATAFVSRSMPQLNIYFVALPAKILVGLALLVVALTQVGPLIRAVFFHGLQSSASLSG